MRITALLIGFSALMAGPSEGRAPPQGVEPLVWMSGDWIEEKGDGWTNEMWSYPRGGVMLGTSLSGSGERAGDHEFMRIVADADGGVTYWGSPGGAPPVPFRLTSIVGWEAIFENPRHDYPTRISYRRQGKVMTATISGPNGANPMSWRYRRR